MLPNTQTLAAQHVALRHFKTKLGLLQRGKYFADNGKQKPGRLWICVKLMNIELLNF
jgi:hypothetical protein